LRIHKEAMREDRLKGETRRDRHITGYEVSKLGMQIASKSESRESGEKGWSGHKKRKLGLCKKALNNAVNPGERCDINLK